MKSRPGVANSGPLPRPEDTDHGLPRPAYSPELEQLVEQAAESTPLPDTELPEDVAEIRSEGFSLGEKFFNLKSLASFVIAFTLIGLLIWKSGTRLEETWIQMKAINI